jgi:hypothetical protein
MSIDQFSPPKTLQEFELEINAAIRIVTAVKAVMEIPDDKMLATIVGLVEIGTGINAIELMQVAFERGLGNK